MKMVFLLAVAIVGFSNSSSYALCTYEYELQVVSENGNDFEKMANNYIERTMQKLGYTLTSDYDHADFKLRTSAHWIADSSEFLTHPKGDSFGRAVLIRNYDSKTIYFSQNESRASFMNLGIGKNHSALRRLKNAMHSIPKCEYAYSAAEVDDGRN